MPVLMLRATSRPTASRIHDDGGANGFFSLDIICLSMFVFDERDGLLVVGVFCATRFPTVSSWA